MIFKKLLKVGVRNFLNNNTLNRFKNRLHIKNIPIINKNIVKGTFLKTQEFKQPEKFSKKKCATLKTCKKQ